MANRSRNTFHPERGYVAVVLQQGVPLVDADWNEIKIEPMSPSRPTIRDPADAALFTDEMDVPNIRPTRSLA